MTDTPKEKYESKRERLHGRSDDYEAGGMVEKGEVTERDASRIQSLCDAFDPDKLDREEHTEKKASFPQDKRKDRSYSTLWGWMYRLSRMARDIDDVTDASDLSDATVSDVNDLMEFGYYEGKHPSSSGMKKGTVRTYQDAARVFYRYHSELEVDHTKIARYSDDDSGGIDPSDMLTRDEIDRLRDATEHPRDNMLFHLLLYTGLRSNAARNLQIKHIDLEDGTYRLNDKAHGNKGADERNGKRPLLYAEGAIRQWLNGYHPCPEDENAYLITAIPGGGYLDPHDPVGHNVPRRVMSKLKDKTGIEKPLNPHALRHNFVTICKRDYELPDDTVKYLIGHAKDSVVMETTYSHLSGDKHIERTRVAADLQDDPEPDSTLSPKVCSCGTKNPPGSKACSNCGLLFTPDAAALTDKVDEAFYQSKGEAEEPEEQNAVDTAREIVESNPDAKAALMEEMKDELMAELKDELSD